MQGIAHFVGLRTKGNTSPKAEGGEGRGGVDGTEPEGGGKGEGIHFFPELLFGNHVSRAATARPDILRHFDSLWV